jgi:hypothetical protein
VADRQDPALEPEDPALAVAARHALHDEELIAGFATDGDAADGAARARSLIERCVTCRDLHADLVAIGAALGATENAEAVAASQRAPRDFRLSFETANELRPGSVVRRLRDRVMDAIGSFSRPVGLSMASLGVVGLVLGTLTFGGLGGAALAPADNGGPGAMGATAAPGAQATGGTSEVAGPTGTALQSLRLSTFDSGPSAGPAATDSREGTPPPGEATPGSGAPVNGGPALPALIVGGSALLLAGGVALLILGSRRREPIPGR